MADDFGVSRVSSVLGFVMGFVLLTVIAERRGGVLMGFKLAVCALGGVLLGRGLTRTLMRMGRLDQLRFGRLVM